MKNDNEIQTKTIRCRQCGCMVTLHINEPLVDRGFCSYCCVSRWEDRMDWEDRYGIHR